MGIVVDDQNTVARATHVEFDAVDSERPPQRWKAATVFSRSIACSPRWAMTSITRRVLQARCRIPRTSLH